MRVYISQFWLYNSKLWVYIFTFWLYLSELQTFISHKSHFIIRKWEFISHNSEKKNRIVSLYHAILIFKKVRIAKYKLAIAGIFTLKFFLFNVSAHDVKLLLQSLKLWNYSLICILSAFCCLWWENLWAFHLNRDNRNRFITRQIFVPLFIFLLAFLPKAPINVWPWCASCIINVKDIVVLIVVSVGNSSSTPV